jgi:excisionase family DNA binding protein
MSLVKTWYTVEEAAAKFGVPQARILEWVDEGVVRSEDEGKTVVRINADDLQLKLEELVRE